jgi:hypothetical protein
MLGIPTSWIVHMETLYSRDPAKHVTISKNLADRVAKGPSTKY